MKKQLSDTLLKDVLYNTHQRSGASVEYGTGVVVGVVGALMATGMEYEEAQKKMKSCLPIGYTEQCIPEAWRKYRDKKEGEEGNEQR